MTQPDSQPQAVIPVLSYANPRAAQPAGSLFTVVELEDGVTMSKPLPPEPWAAAALVGAITSIVGITNLFLAVIEQAHYLLGLGIPFCVLGGSIFLALRVRRAERSLIIELRRGNLTVRNMPGSLSRRWVVRRPREFKASIALSQLPLNRCHLQVVSRFRLRRNLLLAIPRDECLWLADLLNKHL